MTAQLGDPEASARFLRALSLERRLPPPPADINWRALLSRPPVERIKTLQEAGYKNDEVAEILGYKDARSVRVQVTRDEWRKRKEEHPKELDSSYLTHPAMVNNKWDKAIRGD